MSTDEQHTVRVGLTMPVDMRQWLRRRAFETDSDMGRIVTEVLQKHIDDVEGQRKSEQ